MSSSLVFVHGGAENCDHCYFDRQGCQPKGRNGDCDRCIKKGWECKIDPNRPRRKEGPSKGSGSASRPPSASTAARPSNVFTPTSGVPTANSSQSNAPSRKQTQRNTGLMLKNRVPSLEDDFEPSDHDSEGSEEDEPSSYEQETLEGSSLSGLVCIL